MNAEEAETIDHKPEVTGDALAAAESEQLEESQIRREAGEANVGVPIERAEHPGGEVFFSGEPGDLSDSEAEELARQQLLRSGLLRGQRVHVGD